MKNVFLHKYWEEEDIEFYIHFMQDEPIRQIEIKNGKRYLTSRENPIIKDSELCDQSLEWLEINEEDYISLEDFEREWEKR